ncbi:GNAT family N-acetyltransferase [Neisseria sp. Ec49-e6-T10]|uniref:GNAT family N-acetyltransferase n=1 Tax=Neisseria sp. Ec49-e6-T10 TaxID=3140744 RepID=UPI003EBC8C12
MNHSDGVVHDESRQRFELEINGVLAYLTYRKPDHSTIDINYTYVPDALRGKGIAACLAKAALAYAQEQNLHIIPSCSYIAQYIAKHKI